MLPEIKEIMDASWRLVDRDDVDVVRMLELLEIFLTDYPDPVWARCAADIASADCLRATRK